MRNFSVTFFIEFGPLVKEEVLLKGISIFSSGSHFVLKSRTIYAIMVEGIMGNIYVNLFSIWTSGSGVNVI